jgi:hypothetical protein
MNKRTAVPILLAVNFDAGGGPRSVAVGDFNGYGLPDLAVADSIPSGVGGATVPLRSACCSEPGHLSQQ